jgi:hypothetical protein
VYLAIRYQGLTMLHLVEPTTAQGPNRLASVTTTGTDDELHRLAMLRRYEIVDSPPEPAFDRITALAADLFNAPISIISFLDHDRLWFKSHHGLDAEEVSWNPSDHSASAIEPRMRQELKPGFFVGTPLTTSGGYALGTLCVIDHRPIKSTNGRAAIFGHWRKS